MEFGSDPVATKVASKSDCKEIGKSGEEEKKGEKGVGQKGG